MLWNPFTLLALLRNNVQFQRTRISLAATAFVKMPSLLLNSIVSTCLYSTNTFPSSLIIIIFTFLFTDSLKISLFAFVIFVLLRILLSWQLSDYESLKASVAQHNNVMTPKFFFCTTTHMRFFPLKYKFQFPILYVGFPATFKGAIGGLFSIKASETEQCNRRSGFSFFSVDPRKYINSELPFESKLEPILKREGINSSEFPHVYIVTSPQFLGYSFNPVSYYFLYDRNMQLGVSLLEINNTFGERHVYVLNNNSNNTSELKVRKGFTFADRKQKDFHISPFNHRSGHYDFQILDPLAGSRFDVHMSVIDESGKKAMVARSQSHGEQLDLLSANWKDMVSMVATWGFNAFLAIPRTMREAYKIYKQKKAPIYQRPEVRENSGGRAETRIERNAREMWVHYLTHAVKTYPSPIKVHLSLPKSDPAKPSETLTLMSDVSSLAPVHQKRELNVRITTPRFFTRFFSHNNTRSVHEIDINQQTSTPEQYTAIISDWQLFLDILDNKNNIVKQTMEPKRWRLVSFTLGLIRLANVRVETWLSKTPSTPPPPRPQQQPGFAGASASKVETLKSLDLINMSPIHKCLVQARGSRGAYVSLSLQVLFLDFVGHLGGLIVKSLTYSGVDLDWF